MNIYENNKQLLTAMGGDSANLANDYEVRKAILDLLGGNSSICSNIYEVDKQILNIYLEGGGAGGSGSERTKVSSLSVNNSCIVDGTWTADGIDTSNVTEMDYMFNNCSSLQTPDVSNLDTSKVTNMSNMFYNCTSLQSLDVSNFDTSNVTNMSQMFYACELLQSLDVSNFDTSNVTNMSYMFNQCRSLQSLDVSNFDTSKVTDIYGMFRYCGENNGTFNAVGGRTIDEVIGGNIGIMNGLSISISSYDMSVYSDRATLRALINGVEDRTGQSSLSMTLGNTNKAKLTDEDIAIATAKNWTIS